MADDTLESTHPYGVNLQVEDGANLKYDVQSTKLKQEKVIKVRANPKKSSKSMFVKPTALILLLSIIQISCVNLRDDLYLKFNDINYIRSETDKKFPGLEVSPDAGGNIWISNVKNVFSIKDNVAKFIKEINREYKEIYIDSINRKNCRIILFYMATFEDLKKSMNEVMDIEPSGMYGFNVNGSMEIEGKKVICSCIGFSADIAEGSGPHELVHLLNKLNLRYLPFNLDEGLVQCVTMETVRPIITTKEKKSYNFHTFAVAEHLKVYGEINIKDIIVSAESSKNNGTWVLGLLLKYTHKNGKLKALIDECEKEKNFSEKTFQKVFNEDLKKINKDFETWLLKEKYLDPALKL